MVEDRFIDAGAVYGMTHYPATENLYKTNLKIGPRQPFVIVLDFFL